MSLSEIVREVDLPHPPDQVWRTFASQEELAAWLMPNDFTPEVGEKFNFHTDPAPGFDGIVHCEVLEFDPPRLWQVSWVAGKVDTVLTITLAPSPGGTRLRLSHAGFGAGTMLPRVILGMGWTRLLRRKLADRLKEEG
ncbi:SRPBCC domain-containing protein [Gymnodinialimonas hymeniacidonis]|uniref:SRPBCC family protein n=1 Tax=Gymnodinialimonas hymeniacidonis TaxID=3126508 RepID=UPI0034C6C188